MPTKRPKATSQSNLFEQMAAPKQSKPKRPETPGILLGTSSFTAKGWKGVFYPPDLQTQNLLSYYAENFQTVEIDSTFYGTPKPSTVENWRQRTPQDFIFAVKIPQIITHEKILVGCEAEFDEFIETMSLLEEKLGPILFQFPKFDKWTLTKSDEFMARLGTFLKRITNPTLRFVVEIRNKNWLDARLTDFLRGHNVALALTDTSFMPRPWELKEKFDLITTDFTYVRWLGDRKGIEETTTTWDKAVVDREDDLKSWVTFLREIVLNKKLRKIFAFANNHYAGHAPTTVAMFEKLWTSR